MFDSSTKDNGAFILPEELTIFTVRECHSALKAHHKNRPHITLDWHQVEDIDGAGVQLLLAYIQHCQQRGGEVNMTNISDAVEQKLSLFFFDRLVSAQSSSGTKSSTSLKGRQHE